jgi:PTH2 family peptidyl-tRNA hydrolase
MIKQVIVMRTKYPCENGSKKLRRGKEIAQACHSSTAFLTRKIQGMLGCDPGDKAAKWRSDNPFSDLESAFLEGYKQAKSDLKISSEELEWIEGIFTKICLKVDTEEQLLEIEMRAKEKGLACHLITDRGLTEFGGVPTRTCLSIGPDLSEKIDEVTGGLELY